MRLSIAWIASVFLAAAVTAAEPPAKPLKNLILPGEAFLVQEKVAFIFWPEESKRSEPQPWIFYAPALPPYPDGHEKWMHQKFLDAGVAVAGIDIGEAYGSPKGQEGFTALYKELTTKRKFAPRPCMLGRSRGGLMVTSWATENTDKVSGIAGIYPVIDFRTYPGLGRAAPAYGLTSQELERDQLKFNPIERVSKLAAAKIPAYLIHGDADKVVPLKENSAEFQDRYEAAAVKELVTLEVPAGQGHNVWEGFFRCQGLIDFAIARAKAGVK